MSHARTWKQLYFSDDTNIEESVALVIIPPDRSLRIVDVNLWRGGAVTSKTAIRCKKKCGCRGNAFEYSYTYRGDWSETNSTGYYSAANEKDVFFFNVKIENVSKDDLTLDSKVYI